WSSDVCSSDLFGTDNPNNGRRYNARNVPPIAMMPQMYPWRLKDAMPPKYAPMLQPNARRAPYPISSPPMTDAKKLPFVTLVNLRSEEHTSELQSRFDLVCRLLLE